MDKIGFNIFSPSHLLNSYKSKGGVGAAEKGLANNSLEDTAVFSSFAELMKSIEKTAEDSKTSSSNAGNTPDLPNFDFSNMSQRELVDACNYLYSTGALTFDELTHLVCSTTYAPGSPGYENWLDMKQDFLEMWTSYVNAGLENKQLETILLSALGKISEFMENRVSVTNEGMADNEGTTPFSSNADNAPTFDFRNMTRSEFEEATIHLLSEGKISMNERILLMLNAGIFSLHIDPKTGNLSPVPPGKSMDSPFKYGSSLDSQTKYNFIAQIEQYIQFQRENGYLTGLKNTESALEKLLALSA